LLRQTDNHSIPGISKKFVPKWSGPWKVVKKISDVNYEIAMNNATKIVHVERLRKFIPWRAPVSTQELPKNILRLPRNFLQTQNTLRNNIRLPRKFMTSSAKIRLPRRLLADTTE
jgi:hypothetical protein